MPLDQLYQEIILDHWKHPRGRGLRDPYGAQSHQVNPTCGDELTVRVQVADGQLVDISYEGMGCSISQASASVLYELLRGQPVDQGERVGAAFAELMGGRGQVEPDEAVLGDAVAFAGVAQYPARIKCALLAWVAFKDAAARAAAGTVEQADTGQTDTARPGGGR